MWRNAYSGDDFISIDCTNGSVWADLIPSGWFVWVTELDSRAKCPVGVYDYDNALLVMLAISDTLM